MYAGKNTGLRTIVRAQVAQRKAQEAAALAEANKAAHASVLASLAKKG